MSWLDKLKKGLNVASLVTAAFPLPSWVKKAQKAADVGVAVYEEVDRRKPVTGKLPMQLCELTYEPPAESALVIQLPGENFTRKIMLGTLAYMVLESKVKKEKKPVEKK